jgi:hypothetical protein
MAIVQISWQDNANNETKFKIYKGTSSPLTSASDLIANVELISGSWVVSEETTGSAPSIAITSSNTGDSVTTGETFVVTYEEGTPNNYFYGVSASNSVGDSDVVTTGTALSVV